MSGDSKAASTDLLRELWVSLAEHLLKRCQEGPTSSEMAVMRRFLADSGVDVSKVAVPRDGAEALGEMLEEAPGFDRGSRQHG